jgi:hypothetical protein
MGCISTSQMHFSVSPKSIPILTGKQRFEMHPKKCPAKIHRRKSDKKEDKVFVFFMPENMCFLQKIN